MEWLNYHHLRYFWVVAGEGSITLAAKKLRRSLPTVSAQLQAMEKACGEKLFIRTGRRLALSETGQQVFRYADEIFSIGEELMETLRGHPAGRPLRMTVGINDALSSIVVHRLLEPAFHYPKPVRILCLQEKPGRLLASLALHEIDIVLSDAPAIPTVKVRVFSHLLGECGITFFGAAKHAPLRRGFPKSLDGAPMFLPSDTAVLRANLDQWFERLEVRPRILGEFDGSTLLQSCGQSGAGIFAAPSAIEAGIRKLYGVQVIGRTGDVRERYYAISAERKLKHPVVTAVVMAAKHKLFA